MGFLGLPCPIVGIAYICSTLDLDRDSVMETVTHLLLYPYIGIMRKLYQNSSSGGVPNDQTFLRCLENVFGDNLFDCHEYLLHRCFADLRIIGALQLRAERQ